MSYTATEANQADAFRPPAFPKLSAIGKGPAIGVFGIVFFIQAFFLLLAINSTITAQPQFGIQWGTELLSFEFYMFLFGGTFLLALTFPKYIPLLIRPGDVTDFVFFFGAILLGGLAVGLGAEFLLGVHGAAIAQNVRIPEIVTVILFVAVVEEWTFRAVLPPLSGWVIAVVAFGIFHVSAYSLELSPGTFFSGLVTAMILGAAFYFAYSWRRKVKDPVTGKVTEKRVIGLGGVIALHAVYDILVLGLVGIGGVALIHLGLVPV